MEFSVTLKDAQTCGREEPRIKPPPAIRGWPALPAEPQLPPGEEGPPGFTSVVHVCCCVGASTDQKVLIVPDEYNAPQYSPSRTLYVAFKAPFNKTGKLNKVIYIWGKTFVEMRCFGSHFIIMACIYLKYIWVRGLAFRLRHEGEPTNFQWRLYPPFPFAILVNQEVLQLELLRSPLCFLSIFLSFFLSFCVIFAPLATAETGPTAGKSPIILCWSSRKLT